MTTCIRISKNTLVVAYSTTNEKYSNAKFANNPRGIYELIKSLPSNAHCVSEAAGSYGLVMVYCLTQSGIPPNQIPVSVVNPKESTNFIKVLLSTVKANERDAVMLSIYGQRMTPKPYMMPDDKIMQYKQFRVLSGWVPLGQLKNQISPLSNLEHALSFHHKQEPIVKEIFQKILTTLEEKIDKIENEITKISTEEFDKIFKLIPTIEGIGAKTASAIIMATNGLGGFDSTKKFTKFIGTIPIIKDSGTSVKINDSISQSGDPELRSLLYMAGSLRCRLL